MTDSAWTSKTSVRDGSYRPHADVVPDTRERWSISNQLDVRDRFESAAHKSRLVLLGPSLGSVLRVGIHRQGGGPQSRPFGNEDSDGGLRLEQTSATDVFVKTLATGSIKRVFYRCRRSAGERCNTWDRSGYAPAWSPDGTEIVFSSRASRSRPRRRQRHV